jgi:hypothetical protein
VLLAPSAGWFDDTAGRGILILDFQSVIDYIDFAADIGTIRIERIKRN